MGKVEEVLGGTIRNLFLRGVLKDLFACKEKAIKWSFILPAFFLDSDLIM